MTANASLTPQTFVCNQTTSAQTVSISYTRVDSGLELGTRTCTVALTQGGGGGAAATGTSEMVIGLTDDGTKSITTGRFDVPVR